VFDFLDEPAVLSACTSQLTIIIIIISVLHIKLSITSSSYSLQIAAAKSSFHHQSQQQIVVMPPPPTMQTATPPPPSTQTTQTSQVVQVNGGGQSLNADKIVNMMPVTKRNPKDYIFGKVIGEGSYSTVSIQI